ncbi:MAG: serine hydrolase [Oceanicaulis sp.]|uniref:serine hydrolase domain-containing protein n=1 Tax=Oceanicaulis TaxID=153232 RepID=UPI000C09FA10|nr:MULTISPECIES: serine hydrolase domain-containing protein [Oceanicaulis]MAP49265.1 serine hydrolase [Oceanicaulis sp.]
MRIRLSHCRIGASLGALSLLLALGACDGPASSPTPGPAPDSPSQTAPAPLPTPGFTQAGLAQLDSRLAELASARQRAGYVAVLARNGEILHTASAGYADLEDQRPMTADTLVRIASMTKPVTAVAALMLIEDGVIALDDPVSDYIPAFANVRVATSVQRDESYEIPTTEADRPITVEDLLTHTSGLGYLFDYQSNLGALYIGNDIYAAEGDMDSRMETLAGLPLYFQPGSAWFYSYASDVLGHLVAVASGQSLEDFTQARIFQPLGMEDTTFFLREDQHDRLAAVYTHGEDGLLTRVASADDAVSVAAFEAGGAGLFSTANDYIRFAQMLANGGALEGARLLSADTVAAMRTAHVQADRMPDRMDSMDLGYGYGVGVIYDGPGAHPVRAQGDFGWSGYFDTEFFVSPSTGVVAVIMSQEQPGPTTPDTIGARAVFDQLVYGAVPSES